MGLSSFNRMRRERAAVEIMEAERFKAWNEQHNASRISKDELQASAANPELLAELQDAELAAVERIGEKNREGIKRGDDMPLRKDHAAEIAGRNLSNVDEPIDPVDHINQRIPQGETANEVLTEHTNVDGEGPTHEMVAAAALEVGSEAPPEPVKPVKQNKPEDDKVIEGEVLPAAASGGEGVAPQGEVGGSSEGAELKIPADWEELHWTQQVKLAEELSGSEVKEADGKTKVEVAREIISARVPT